MTKRRQRGAALVKVLLLIFFLGLAVGFWMWKGTYGRIGTMKPLTFSTVDQVAFLRAEVNGRTNLYVVKLDGTEEQRLTDDLNPKRGLAWAPDGKQLCYAAETRDENITSYQLFLFGSTGARQVTVGSGSKHSIDWRPDGKRISFMVGGVLKMVAPNGKEMEQVYPHLHKETGEEHEDDEDTRKRPPLAYYKWAPDGSMIAAVQVAEGEQAMVPGQTDWFRKGLPKEEGLSGAPQPETLLILPAGGSDATIRPETNSSKVGCSWFPDSKQIACSIIDRRGLQFIALLRGDEPRMAAPTVFEAARYTISVENPSVSPDGKQIAFEAWRADSSENRDLLGIAVISAEPRAKILIRSAADISKLPIVVKGRTTNPQWTRDGSRLIYQVTESNGRRDIWSAGPDGSSPINLTKGKGDNFDPFCSPAK